MVSASRDDAPMAIQDSPILRVVPPIVTLCGSTKFRDAFHAANARLTMEGKIVLSVGFFMHAEGQHAPDCLKVCVGAPGMACSCGAREVTSEQKGELDLLHFRKIALSDAVLVLNVGGYIGDSTRREIAFAIAVQKGIAFHEPVAGDDYMSANSHVLGRMVSEFVQGKIPAL